MRVYRHFRNTSMTLLAIVFCAATLHPIPSAAASLATTNPLPTVNSNAVQHYGDLALSFIPNVGEADSAVRYQVRSGAGTLFFTPAEVVLSLSNGAPHTAPAEKIVTPAEPSSVVRLRFEGANPAPTITSAEPLPGIVNEFIGNDPAQWHSNIPTYAGVVYKDLYPGIDLRYDGHTGLLKGTYTVAPHADPMLIRWQYGGVTGAHIDSNSGDLLIDLPNGKTLTEQAPIVWQQYAGQHIPVEVHYTQSDTGEIGFAVGNYDARLPLVIDPTLVYSTYLGGSGVDSGLSIAVDSSGSAYVTGYTRSIDFPTAAALQTTFKGGASFGDAFVTKLNPGGTALIYSTYLGGSADDVGTGITTDSSGNAYITGETFSADFPTTPNAFRPIFGGGLYDGFVTKLNSIGATLVYSTYLGGSSNDSSSSLTVDSSGSAYIIGSTNSTDFPVIAGAFQTMLSGGSDVFVTKLNTTGTAMIYSTYLGGSNDDRSYGLGVDSGGNAYITGSTLSTNFPTTVNAFQMTFGSASMKAFVTKLNPSGITLVYSTYLGGNNLNIGSDLAIDSNGNAYVTGETSSSDFPVAAGAFQTIASGGDSGFVTKLNTTGTGLIYSTFLNGSIDYSITVDSSNSAYITGIANSSGFPTTTNAVQTISGGGHDAFVTKLNAAGNGLIYSTYLGGSLDDNGWGIAVDSSDNIYVTGTTGSSNFPKTVSAYQMVYGGGNDAFVTKLTLPPISPIITSADHATFKVGNIGTFTVTATGNPIPTFSATGLPAWATLNPTTGAISGRPLNSVGSPFAVTITAGNGVLPNATQTFTLTVGAGPLDTIGIFRPSTATFYLRNANTTGSADITTALGGSTDWPITGDWNGDGIDTVGVYRTGQFYLRDSNTPGAPIVYSFALGISGDVPIAGDWNNDGKDGVGVFRPSNGLIYLKNGLTTGFADFQMVLGVPGDVPVAGDWNGDGIDSPGVYRPSLTKFFLSNQVCNCSVFADYNAALGVAGDTPFAGDWNGDGITGIGVFRPSNGLIYLKNMPSSGFADLSLIYGIANDKPVAGHWAALAGTPSLAPTFVP